MSSVAAMLREEIYVEFIGGPKDGQHAVIPTKDLRRTYCFYDWPDERRGYTPPVRRYNIVTTREAGRAEVQKLREAQEREWDAFNAHYPCDDRCHDWLDALEREDDRLKLVEALVEGFGFENGGALYFYEL